MLWAIERSAVRALHTSARAAARYGLRADIPVAETGDKDKCESEQSSSASASTGTPTRTSSSSSPSSSSASEAVDMPSEASASAPASSSSHSTTSPWSSSSLSASPSNPSSSTAAPADELADLSIDALWDRVIRTPSAVLSAGSSTETPGRPTLKSFLDKSARPRTSSSFNKYAYAPSGAVREWDGPSERSASASSSSSSDPSPSRPGFGLASTRMQRALGQTRAEGARFDDALGRLFQEITDRSLRPATGQWSDMVRGPQHRRKEDADPALTAEVEGAAEALGVLTSAADVVAWAEEHVFVRTAEGYARTYPRLLAAVMGRLRKLGAPHLSLAMFAHARALGLESFLAGCQTSAFNQLLRTRWDAFRDLHGVADAVGDMDKTGVAWDKNTKVIVAAVVDYAGAEILARREHRWGADDAYRLVQVLERRLEADSSRENAVFERKIRDKRAFRQYRRDGWGELGERGERGERGDRGGAGAGRRGEDHDGW